MQLQVLWLLLVPEQILPVVLVFGCELPIEVLFIWVDNIRQLIALQTCLRWGLDISAFYVLFEEP